MHAIGLSAAKIDFDFFGEIFLCNN